MRDVSAVLRVALTPLLLALSLAGPLLAQNGGASPESDKIQLPADQTAFKAAKNIAEPDRKLAALRQFEHDFPASKLLEQAHKAAFDTLLASFPERRSEINKEAKILLAYHRDGRDLLNEENTLAFALAEAGSNGVDLKSAQKWAQDAVKRDTMASLRQDADASAVKFKVPKMTDADATQYYGEEHASVLQTLADVYLHEGKYPRASAVLDQAQALDPDNGSCFVSRAQIALAQHDDAQALSQFELAALHGALNQDQDATLHKLYATAHNGTDAGLSSELDERYRKLMPPTFVPKAYDQSAVAHTPLLELFTGSGCDPCTAMDLAFDAVEQAYPRQDVVLLEYDQHIPRPDPLANPDGVARAKAYHLAFTPSVFLDGHQLDVTGGNRKESEKAYNAVSTALNAAIPEASGVDLLLQAGTGPDGTISARAKVRVARPELVSKALARHVEASPKAPPATSAPTATPKLVLNFALVQTDITYTGENGIRFHHMVVRALAKPSEIGFPSKTDFTTEAQASFDPSAISHALTEYLDTYAKTNERFGPIHFLSTDTTLPASRLGVAAWIEDPGTHRVLQASYSPLLSSQAAQDVK